MPITSLRNINKGHLPDLEDLYLTSEPYSDFNVVSLWGYMIPGAKFFKDGNFAVFEMTDYNTNEKYYSCFGRGNPEQAISKLFSDLTTPITFRHVPEDTYLHIKDSPALIDSTEDIDNNDYIFSVEKIAKLDTETFRSKRKSLKKFRAKYPNITVRTIDIGSYKERRRMYNLFRLWIRQSKSSDYQREFRALKRAIKLKDFPIVCIGAFDGRSLVGFTVNEIEKNGYYQGHFGKANYKYPSLGLFLETETAKYLYGKYRCKLMNLQQDMGIEGIRYYKQSLHPERQLRKFSVTIDPGRCRSNLTTKPRTA